MFLTWFQGSVGWLIGLVELIVLIVLMGLIGCFDWFDWLRGVPDLVPGCGETQAVQPLLPQHKIVFNLRLDKSVRFLYFCSISFNLNYFCHCSCLAKSGKHLNTD